MAVLLHYLFLASFLWMLLEGVYLYVLIVEVFSTVKVWYLYVFAWGKFSSEKSLYVAVLTNDFKIKSLVLVETEKRKTSLKPRIHYWFCR